MRTDTEVANLPYAAVHEYCPVTRKTALCQLMRPVC
jgi:hypothetical protein